MKLSHFEVAVTGETSSEILRTFRPFDKADCYAAAAGVEYYLRLGIGYTYKRISSNLSPTGAGGEIRELAAKATAHDYGVIAELPLIDLIAPRLSSREFDSSGLSYTLTPSYAYVKANISDSITYPGASQSEKLPTVNRNGIVLFGSVNVKSSSLLSFKICREIDKKLVGKATKLTRHGFEIGILGFAFIRSGSYDDENGNAHVNTSGFGLSAAGIISWLKQSNILRLRNDLVGNVINRVDLAFDYASYSGVRNLAVGNTKFYGLRLSF